MCQQPSLGIRVTPFYRDLLAQLVARFLDMEKVTGSSPVQITNFLASLCLPLPSLTELIQTLLNPVSKERCIHRYAEAVASRISIFVQHN